MFLREILALADPFFVAQTKEGSTDKVKPTFNFLLPNKSLFSHEVRMLCKVIDSPPDTISFFSVLPRPPTFFLRSNLYFP